MSETGPVQSLHRAQAEAARSLVERNLREAATARVARGDVSDFAPAPGERVVLEGFASTFGEPADKHGQVIARGAFRKAARRIRRGEALPLRVSHEEPFTVGRVTWASETRDGLRFRGELDSSQPMGRYAAARVRAGTFHAASVGMKDTRSHHEVRSGRVVCVVTAAGLREITLTDHPANPRAVLLRVWTEPREEERAC